MDTEGFRQFLRGRKIPEDKVEPFMFIRQGLEPLNGGVFARQGRREEECKKCR
jgi:hypothetical protein